MHAGVPHVAEDESARRIGCDVYVGELRKGALNQAERDREVSVKLLVVDVRCCEKPLILGPDAPPL